MCGVVWREVAERSFVFTHTREWLALFSVLKSSCTLLPVFPIFFSLPATSRQYTVRNAAASPPHPHPSCPAQVQVAFLRPKVLPPLTGGSIDCSGWSEAEAAARAYRVKMYGTEPRPRDMAHAARLARVKARQVTDVRARSVAVKQAKVIPTERDAGRLDQGGAGRLGVERYFPPFLTFKKSESLLHINQNGALGKPH